MDNQEQERSSNSQNDKTLSISNVERGSARGIAKISFSDGSSFFVADDLLENIDFSNEVDFEFISNIEYASFETNCRQKGLDLLARRAHSCYELKNKLLKRNFSADIVNSVLDWLNTKKYLNDADFARQWIHSRMQSKPEGPTALRAGLKKKGIAGSIITEIVNGIDNEIFDEAIQKAADKLMRKSKITKEKFIMSLQRRGFSYGKSCSIATKYFDTGSYD